MTQSPEVTDYIASIQDADAQLATHLAALRVAARAVNDLGALASAVQRAAQDVEYVVVDPKLREFLDGSYIQRTGFVNQRAAAVAEQLRLLSRGIADLMADGEKAIALASATSEEAPT